MFEGLLQPVHLIIILAIVMIVFGPGKLPGLGGALGKGIREFRDSVKEVESPDQPATATVAQPVEEPSDKG